MARHLQLWRWHRIYCGTGRACIHSGLGDQAHQWIGIVAAGQRRPQTAIPGASNSRSVQQAPSNSKERSASPAQRWQENSQPIPFGRQERNWERRGRTCTLAMTREPEAAPTAGSYDEAYASDINLGGTGGSANRFIVRLSIAKGQGAGTMTSPGCSPSPFPCRFRKQAISAVSGNFNCVLGGVQQITGPLTISGRHDGKVVVLHFSSERGGSIRNLRLARQAN